MIETLVLLTVVIMVLIAIVAAVRYSYQGQRFAFEAADATRSARTGIERIVREFREASDADNGAYPIGALATSSAVFFSDFDNDGKIERVRYFLDDTDVKRGVVESSGDPPTYVTSTETISVVSDNVRNEAVGTPLFTFYDDDGAVMNDLGEVDDLAFVVVRLVVNVQPGRAPEDVELRSSAALRNIVE